MDSAYEEPNSIDEIIPPDELTGIGGLYLGDIDAARDLSTLKDLDIRAVVSLVLDANSIEFPEESKESKDSE